MPKVILEADELKIGSHQSDLVSDVSVADGTSAVKQLIGCLY